METSSLVKVGMILGGAIGLVVVMLVFYCLFKKCGRKKDEGDHNAVNSVKSDSDDISSCDCHRDCGSSP